MSKNFFVVSVLILLVILIPKISLANSISLRSSSKNIEPSKNFSLLVYVDSSSSQSFTAQANIDFPADLISVESFTYSSAWLPINQTGYDIVDNTNGKLIKTAGYPNGFNSEILLGTIVFKSKKAGTVNIAVNNASYVLDMDSNNTLTNRGSFSINSSAPVITAPVIKVEEKPKPVNTPKTPDVKKPVIKTETVKTNVEEPIVLVESPISQENIKRTSVLNNLILFFNSALTVNQFFNIFL
jgi:hypothetical protein